MCVVEAKRTVVVGESVVGGVTEGFEHCSSIWACSANSLILVFFWYSCISLLLIWVGWGDGFDPRQICKVTTKLSLDSRRCCVFVSGGACSCFFFRGGVLFIVCIAHSTPNGWLRSSAVCYFHCVKRLICFVWSVRLVLWDDTVHFQVNYKLYGRGSRSQ